MAKVKEANTTGDMRKILPCLCRSGMVQRGHRWKVGKGLKSLRVFLFCMLCDRRAEAKTPKECIELWNKTCGEMVRL